MNKRKDRNKEETRNQTHPPKIPHPLVQPRRKHRIHITEHPLVLPEAQFPPQEAHDGLEALVRRALEARLAERGRVGEGREADRYCLYALLVVCVQLGHESKHVWTLKERQERRGRHVPFANSISPAVSSARVASLGRWSRTTEAAIVMGRVASALALSVSGSGGTEEGEGGDGEGECGWGEAMVVSVGVLASCSVLLFLAVDVSVWEGELRSGGELPALFFVVAVTVRWAFELLI